MNNGKLLILGAGQYSTVVRETAEAMGCFERIDHLDDCSPAAVGGLEDAEKLRSQYDNAFVAIGNPGVRKAWVQRLLALGYALPVIRHPQSTVMPSAKVAMGCMVEAQVVINSNAMVGTACLICAGAVVNHNAAVDAYCQIDCNAVVTARSHVPQGTKVPCGQIFEN